MTEMEELGEGEGTMDFIFVTEGKFNHDRILWEITWKQSSITTEVSKSPKKLKWGLPRQLEVRGP